MTTTPTHQEDHVRTTFRCPLAALALATALAACGAPSQGDVSAKGHRDSYCTTTYVQSGKTMVPITSCYPEAWYLTLRDCDVPRGEDCNTGDVEVTEDVYNSADVGDFYEDPDGDG